MEMEALMAASKVMLRTDILTLLLPIAVKVLIERCE